MDVYDTQRRPLVPAERNSNAPATTDHRPRTREISSRYKSPTPSVSRRSSSPSVSRTTVPTNSQPISKRAQSVERRRPLTPPSPSRPSTPVQDSSVSLQLPSRRLSTGSRIPESLWPSTMRSLNVSFQSDIISIRTSKKEKPISNPSSDRTLRPSSNVAHKQQAETPARSRKPTPERKKTPLKGKKAPEQAENAKPIDASHARLIDQHRWPGRLIGKASSISSYKSLDLSDKSTRIISNPVGIGFPSIKRSSSTGSNMKPLRKSVSEAAKLSCLEDIGITSPEANAADDTSPQFSSGQKLVASSISDRMSLITSAVKSTSGSRPASPSRTSVSRGVSPARLRPSTPPSRGVSPTPSRGVSPTRTSSSSQSNSSTSVLSFIVDVKKGKKSSSYIEDAHQIRLLYNRYLQWRFANARAEAVLYVQKVTAEKTLYNVWNNTLALWDSVIQKRMDLQELKLELKLSAILNNQMAHLDDWALLEMDHVSSLSGALEDLEATTLRIPVTGGAKADIDSLKIAICSAVDVMQAMGSSICSLLSMVEGVNTLVSELAVVAAEEKAMLDECEALLASTAALQVQEYSISTHLIQMKHVVEIQSILSMATHQWH
ncbi:AUGMIN subunit 8-like [Euphorbia lathyris]|uniref:AUGMIN subunit 8-like n=1 Tax=Euphorbia lathyris TaxID=212925 RepID=UPI0033132E9C